MPLGYGHYAIYQNNATYFTHPNTLGSTTMVTDYNGNVVQDKLFYPWGQDWQSIGTVYDERFAKLQRRDTETGFDPTSHRAYCAGYGRWLSPDPWHGDTSDPQTLNRYAYAAGNPVTRTDSSGLCSVEAVPSDPFGGDALDYLANSEVLGGGDNAAVYWTANLDVGDLLGVGVAGGCGGDGGGGGADISKPWSRTFPCTKNATQLETALEGNFAKFADNFGPIFGTIFPPGPISQGETLNIDGQIKGIIYLSPFTENIEFTGSESG